MENVEFEKKSYRVGPFMVEHNAFDKDEICDNEELNERAKQFLGEYGYVPYVSIGDDGGNFYTAIMYGCQMYYLISLYLDCVDDGKVDETATKIIVDKLTAMYFVCTIPGDIEYHDKLITLVKETTDAEIEKYENDTEDGKEKD